MAYVCVKCFSDSELIAFINSQGKIDDCSFCGIKGEPCILIDELSDFFAELLSHFRPKATGTMLKSVIQGNWSLFSSLNTAYAILNHFLGNASLAIAHADELVSFSDDILENIGYWDKLKHQLIHQSRYITDINYLTDELGWDGFFSTQVELKESQTLYRARLHHHSGEPAFTCDKMFCPPSASTTAGRANPLGIPYLYLSDNPDTVLYEIRGAFLDEVSVGIFTVKSQLTQSVMISDFTEATTIFHPARIGERIKSTLLKQQISRDLSRPMRRYDSELDYIPTQFICEFIKVYTGVSGIKFRSSLHVSGNNFVIFDQHLLDCTKVNQVKISRVAIFI